MRPLYTKGYFSRPGRRDALAFRFHSIGRADAILAELKRRIWGVSVSAQSWRSGSASVPGVQIDLVLDRADNVVNLCEMKWVGSGAAYTIDKAGAADLLRRAEVFASETGTSNALHTTLVTPGGLAPGKYSGAVQSVVTAEDLFVS